MSLSYNQVRGLVSYLTIDRGDVTDQSLVDIIKTPENFYLHPLFTIHLNESEDYKCNQALLIRSSTQVEFFTFDPPISTALRLRHGATITIYESEFVVGDENDETYHYAVTQMFHKGLTYFRAGLVPSRFTSEVAKE